ncbi:MAG: helix-turn-helix domain-containing protein [Alphaproteobacteria bacterium]|nr:helix-turn-helix domain-containing protein [Alphaproteobacteria bacterium]
MNDNGLAVQEEPETVLELIRARKKKHSKKLLNIKEAMSYIGISKRSNFINLVESGEIGYKILGKNGRKYFTTAELDRWLNELSFHTNYTNVEKYITFTSPSKHGMGKEYSLEKLLAKKNLQKLKDIA